MKVLLIGAHGQLGSDLAVILRSRGDVVVAPMHADLDVRDAANVRKVIHDLNPDVVISTAAFHKVEECESDPSKALTVNGIGSGNLATACNSVGCRLVFFSTDYVFGDAQRKPYLEEDAVRPLNVYGASKVAGEHLIAIMSGRHLIVRTSGLYGLAGSSGKGGNFPENMLKRAASGAEIRVVCDQVLTPSYTMDVARAVGKLIALEECGIVHISNEGECSWFEFTCELFGRAGVLSPVVSVTTDQFPSPVKRPAYSVLSKTKLKSLGIEMPTWQDAVARYLEARRSGAADRS